MQSSSLAARKATPRSPHVHKRVYIAQGKRIGMPFVNSQKLNPEPHEFSPAVIDILSEIEATSRNQHPMDFCDNLNRILAMIQHIVHDHQIKAFIFEG